ncbi:modification methylase (Adenine-specificmethyltransferase) [Aggregatibacter aphrophilus NJ8700]|nr:modification methylase (Adenine-specificmethyltransferase) [Aggregatibacter aphrophilus NJ8700]
MWMKCYKSIFLFLLKIRHVKSRLPIVQRLSSDCPAIVQQDYEKFNFLIEGDNLHSLKLLEKTHRNKIDLIYIDPPYNRGKSDFIYDDHYIDNNDGYKHSKWLSFMSKRLDIARNLLKDTGLIFISIDDNEDSQLKLLCEQIFSPENFINKFIWQRNSSGKTEKDKFTVNTEYVILFSKSNKYKLNPTYKPLSENTKKLYSKNDNDGRGNYRLYPLQKPKDPGPETSYDYIDKSGKIWKCPVKGWRIKKEKMELLENENRLYLEGKTLSEKAYWLERENEGKRIDTLWNDISENTVGSKELENTLGKKEAFDNPKPLSLIKRCLEISNKNALILDFFAGSGTTGHAVAQLNKEDGGNRQYILCTNNENNICEEVTYQRLKNIQAELPHNLKYFKTDFIKKFDENDRTLKAQLMDYIKELIELEYMCEIDGLHNILVKNESELDAVLNENLLIKARLFIAPYVLLSRAQNALVAKKQATLIEIPEYYFRPELIEAGEL